MRIDAAHILMSAAIELSVGGDTACVQGDVKTASTTACEQELNAELDEVSVAGVVCPSTAIELLVGGDTACVQGDVCLEGDRKEAFTVR